MDTNKKGPLVLLGVGIGIAALICVVSISLFGRVYFFDGYDITKIAWVVALGCIACGFIWLVSGEDSILNRSPATTIVLAVCALVGLGLVVAGIGKMSKAYDASQKDYSYSDYYDSDYIRNTFESCCSTATHRQALYSYDLNNDNSISGYEMELFLDAHPKAVNDKQFMSWMKSLVE